MGVKRCWVRACVDNKDGICQRPDRPRTTGCAYTWVLTNQLPEKRKEKESGH